MNIIVSIYIIYATLAILSAVFTLLLETCRKVNEKIVSATMRLLKSFLVFNLSRRFFAACRKHFLTNPSRGKVEQILIF